MNPAFLVGVGGMLGALSRHLVGRALPGERRDTLAVNVVGSFVLGALTAGLTENSAMVTLFGTGFCGAFTTFSSFAFETVRLYERGERRRAVGNATVNLVGALVAVALGGTAATLLSG
ncbi:fluoride efflux transporter FluC [Haladaptatus salinisoli]|uniref:fluoride efflux transporter FluC n=1 Tax=Haladaptatus salinisoli TaxID=2884876 RepID=UPI001D0ABE3A|nr:CrcB family protein [Haladaptatus salinisoli]